MSVNIALRKQDPTNFAACYKGGREKHLLEVFRDLRYGYEVFSIHSPPPSDFRQRRDVIYLTYSKDVADSYARMSRRIKNADNGDKSTPVGVLEIQVPKNIIDGGMKISGDSWKEVGSQNERDRH